MRGDNVAIPGLADLTEIGRGGFGVVYRATETELGREVAVKLLTGPLDERSRTRFERERRAMGVLSSHPNIVTVFRSGNAPSGEPFLVMEYLPGGSYADRLRQAGPMDWRQVLSTGIELCGALESAHRAGVLHRDVKPGNIMMDGLGRAQLGDFGIARLDGSPETKSSVITASVAHAPPEVIAGEKPDERSDVYSLASTLFELIQGAPAFVRSTDESMIPLFARIVNDPTPDLRASGVPDPMASVLERAMAKGQADRYRSAADFGQALIEVQQRLGLPLSQLWMAGEAGAGPLTATQAVAPPPSTGAPSGPAPTAPPPAGPPAGHPAPSAPPTSWPQPSGPAQPTPGAPPQPAPVAAQPLAGYPAPGSAPAGPGQGTGYLPPPGVATASPSPYTSGPVGPPATKSTPWIPIVGGVLLLGLVGVVLLALTNGGGDDQASGDDQQVQALSGDPDDGSDSGDDESTTTTTESTTTTEAPSTTPAAPPPTAPARSVLLADLPSLPVEEAAYGDYRTVSDPDRSFIVDIPDEWVDLLPTDGQIIASPDNNAALADASIPGGVVSGSQGIGIWDPDLFLDTLIESAADSDDPCSEVARDIYDDGVFTGLLYAEYCNGGELLVVSVLATDPNQETVFLVSAQMTDERDMAAFQRMLDSFVLLDPNLLPIAE